MISKRTTWVAIIDGVLYYYLKDKFPPFNLKKK